MTRALPPVIGIVGAMGAGKSTLSKMLVEQHGYTRVSMATPLKDMLVALGLTDLDVNGPQEHRARPSAFLGGKSPRHALQTLGTEWGRVLISPDIWVNAVQERIVRHQTWQATSRSAKKPTHAGVVIDDIRFPNEWDMVHRLGGQVWRVRRPEVEKPRSWMDRAYYQGRWGMLTWIARMCGWRPVHESEYHWPDAPSDAEFFNDGTPEELAQMAAPLLTQGG